MEEQAVTSKYPEIEIYREKEGDYYSPRIYVHKIPQGDIIHIDVGGHVIGMSIRDWHALAKSDISPAPTVIKKEETSNADQ